MKRIFIFILLSIVLLVAGCSPQNNGAPALEPQKPENPELKACERDIKDVQIPKLLYIVCENNNQDATLEQCLSGGVRLFSLWKSFEIDSNFIEASPGSQYPTCRNATEVGENVKHIYCFGTLQKVEQDVVDKDGTIIRKGRKISHSVKVVVKSTGEFTDSVGVSRRLFPVEVVEVKCSAREIVMQPIYSVE